MKQRPYHVVGQRIRLARETRGISQHDFATQLGIEQSHVWKWEAGLRRPCWERLIEISRTLRVSLDFIMCGIRKHSGLPGTPN